MKKEVILTIFLLLIGIPGAIRANFWEFWRGDQITYRNLTVTIAYFMLWLVILGIALKSKNGGIAKFCFMFWAIMLFISIMALFANNISSSPFEGIYVLIAIPLFTPWYGITFFVKNIDKILLCISLIMSIVSFTVSNRLSVSKNLN